MNLMIKYSSHNDVNRLVVSHHKLHPPTPNHLIVEDAS